MANKADQSHYSGNMLRRGFELACRLFNGEKCDAETLQAELGVSRATAYRYQAVVRESLLKRGGQVHF